MVKEAKAEEKASQDAKVAEEADASVSEEKTVDEIKEILEEESVEETAEAAEGAAEEEEKAAPRKKKEEDEDIVEERIYTIPLVKALARPPKKRAPRAMQLIREFIIKHMKLEIPVEAEEEKEELPKLVISNEVNEKVWSRGIEKPPRKIRVRAAKDKDGNVTLYLAEGE
ncbi:MAG: 50S ribosomal protein L31e [Candidatus Bathyarchaeia archaeon]